MKTHNPASIAQPGGPYSHAVQAPAGGRWLYISGQVGVATDGSVPADFGAQVELAWKNLVAILTDAGMTVDNLVKVTHYLLDASDLATYGPIRARFVGDARPASTLVIVKALVRPEWRVEVEAVAWCP